MVQALSLLNPRPLLYLWLDPAIGAPEFRATHDNKATCFSLPRALARKMGKGVLAEMSTRRIVIDVPEKVLLAEKTDETAFGREIRVLAAVKLYELGRLSSGRAAELAGMSRVEFLSILGRYRVFPFEAELRDLEAGLA